MKTNNIGNKGSSLTTKIPQRGKEKIKKAEVSYRKLMEEVEPFIRKRKSLQYSTAGKWKVLSHET